MQEEKLSTYVLFIYNIGVCIKNLNKWKLKVRRHFNFSVNPFVEGDLNSSRIVFFFALSKKKKKKKKNSRRVQIPSYKKKIKS